MLMFKLNYEGAGQSTSQRRAQRSRGCENVADVKRYAAVGQMVGLLANLHEKST